MVLDGAGAVVTLEFDDGRQVRHRAGSDGSYLSAGDPRVIFGLSGRGRPAGLEVRWPSGSTERFPLTVGRGVVLIQEGKGLAGSE